MPWGLSGEDRDLLVPTAIVDGRRIVLAPFLGTAWVSHDAAYRRRRRIASAIVVTVTATATAVSTLFVLGLARPGTPAATVFATAYGLLVLVGLWSGRRWLAQAPARARWTTEGGGFLVGAAVFVFTPVLAGFGLAVLPALFGADFPGERRAREVTAQLAQSPIS